MRRLNRVGTTLIELLIALTLLAALSALAATFLSGLSRIAVRARVGLTEQRTVGTLGRIVRHELNHAEVGEVAQFNTTTLKFNREIGDGLPCGTDSNSVLVPKVEWRGVRLPDPARDMLFLLAADPAVPWLETRITAFSSAHCADGQAAWQFTVDPSTPKLSYVHVIEPVRLSVYKSNGADWYGLAPGDGSSSTQPFAGPVQAGTDLPRVNATELELPGKHLSGRGYSVPIPLAPRIGTPP